MTKVIRLAPHDPLPEWGSHAIVLRRFGEDDPNALVTEIVFSGPHGSSTPAHNPDGSPVDFEAAVNATLTEARHRGLDAVYALDRTAGGREQMVIRNHGNHAVASETLSDTDPEDGEQGSTILDRPHDAGFLR